MTTTRVETLPASWDDARDLPFFRITDHVFSPDFCFGASVLLASYDDSLCPRDTYTATEVRSVTATPATTPTHTGHDGGRTQATARRPR